MPKSIVTTPPLLLLVTLLAALVVAALYACGRRAEVRDADTKRPAQSDAGDILDRNTGSKGDDTTVHDNLASLFTDGSVSSIRVIGDSITAGYLLEGYDLPSDTGEIAYAGREGCYFETSTTVANWANAFRAYAREHGVSSFVNASVSGFLMQFLAEQPDAWLGEGADVIVVMLGTNDAARLPFEEFRTAAEIALSAAADRCEHLVVVSPPSNKYVDAYIHFPMGQVDSALTEICAEHGWEHISLLDVLEVDSGDFLPDLVHPSEQGSAKLWEAFRDRLGLPD